MTAKAAAGRDALGAGAGAGAPAGDAVGADVGVLAEELGTDVVGAVDSTGTVSKGSAQWPVLQCSRLQGRCSRVS